MHVDALIASFTSTGFQQHGQFLFDIILERWQQQQWQLVWSLIVQQSMELLVSHRIKQVFKWQQ